MRIRIAFCLLLLLYPSFTLPGHAQVIEQILELGINLSDSGKYEESRILLNEVLKHNPLHAKALNCIGITFTQEGDIDSAICYFNRALDADSGYYNANINLGRAYSLQKDYSQALLNLFRYANIYPDSSQIWVEIARIYEDQGINDSVVFFLNLAIHKDSSNYFSWAERARYFLNLDLHCQALLDINTADSLNPDDIDVLRTRGIILDKMGDYKNALPDYNKVLAFNPDDVESRMSRMIIYLVLEEYNLCQEDAQIILKEWPDDLTAIYCLAMCAIYTGDLDESIRLIQIGIEKAPGFAGFYSLMGRVLTRQGNYTEAGMFLNRALELNPEDIGSYFYKTEAAILSQTDPAVLMKNQYPPEFLLISSQESDKIDKLAKSKKSTYYYDNLKKKFSQDWRSLSLDEFFMLYYGHTMTDRYAPYARGERIITDSILSQMNRGLNIEAVKTGKDYLADHPSEISIYFYTGLAYLNSSMYADAEEFFYKYFGFIISIMATGNGEKAESAYIVISTNDEYTLMNYLGYSVLEQELIENIDHFFDILSIVTNTGDKKEIYFNVSKPFKTLYKVFK